MKDDNTPEMKISSADVDVDVQKLKEEICDVSGGVVNVGVDVGVDVGLNCNAVDSGNQFSKNEAPRTDVDEALPTSSESSLLSCVVCGSVESLKFCSGCKTTHYCSKSCQVSHWSYHSVYCRAVSDLVVTMNLFVRVKLMMLHVGEY